MIGFRDTSLEALGLQHGVAVDRLTGAATVRVEVRLSAGREGFGPQLGLMYGSGGGNSAFGLGWALTGLPAIGVDTRRRLPSYDGDDGYTHGGTELVPALRRQGSGWAQVVDPGPGPGWRVERWRARV